MGEWNIDGLAEIAYEAFARDIPGMVPWRALAEKDRDRFRRIARALLDTIGRAVGA